MSRIEGGGGGAIEISGGGGGGASHDAVTLTAAAAVLLALSGQELDLDTQLANLVFAGPVSGGAAAPTFRALADADIPAAIARDSELHTKIARAVITFGSEPDGKAF